MITYSNTYLSKIIHLLHVVSKVRVLQLIPLHYHLHFTPQKYHNIQNQVHIWLHLLHNKKHSILYRH